MKVSEDDRARRGCFAGSIEEFKARVEQTYEDSPQHLDEYRAAIAFFSVIGSIYDNPKLLERAEE